MSSKDTQEKRRRSGRPLMILPILLFGLLGVVFYWGLWNNDDRLPSTLIGPPASIDRLMSLSTGLAA